MQRYHFPLPPLYFLHIPKTAGTSLKYWLQDFYGTQERLKVQIFEELDQVTREEVNAAGLVAGHLRWQMFDWFDTPRLSMTWLRDPVKRAISNFQFNQQQFPMLVAQAEKLGQASWIEYYQECQKRSLGQMIDDGMYIGYLDNVHIRHLTDCFSENEARPVDEAVLEQAKQNLDKLTFVGICEWMDQSIDLCCSHLGLPYHPLKLKYNTTSTEKKRVCDAADLEKVAYAERFDRQLYDYAQARFEQQFSEFWQRISEGSADASHHPTQVENPAQLLQELRSQYALPPVQQLVEAHLRDNFYLKHPHLPLVNTAEVNFADAVFLNNWYPRWPKGNAEVDADIVVRWAGPENRSTVLLPLKPGSDYEVCFQIENCADRKFIEGMQIFANGFPVPVKSSFVKHLGLVWFLIPQAAFSGEHRMTEIAFEVPGDIQPAQFDETSKISFSTTGFWFRASARNDTLANTWLSHFESSGELTDLTEKKISMIPQILHSIGFGNLSSTSSILPSS